jgi:hypothetical protein
LAPTTNTRTKDYLTATQELNQLLIKNKNDGIQTFPVEGDKEKKKQVKKPSAPLMTSQGTWARSNVERAHAFAEHLTLFSRIPQKTNSKRKKRLYNFR